MTLILYPLMFVKELFFLSSCSVCFKLLFLLNYDNYFRHFFQSGKLCSDWMTSCPSARSLLCSAAIYILGCCDAWHPAYRTGCLCWLRETCQLKVLEPSCNEMLYWIFPLKIKTKPTSAAFIKTSRNPSSVLLCVVDVCFTGNQNRQTHHSQRHVCNVCVVDDAH